MKLLLDTPAVVWRWLDDPRLPDKTCAVIAAVDNTVCVSAASAWGVATRNGLGKWSDVRRIVDEFSDMLRRFRFMPLLVSVEHACLVGALPGPHRNPFDRLLIAQSKQENAVLVNGEGEFRQIWD